MQFALFSGGGMGVEGGVDTLSIAQQSVETCCSVLHQSVAADESVPAGAVFCNVVQCVNVL